MVGQKKKRYLLPPDIDRRCHEGMCFMGCMLSENLVCKHVRATKTFFFNLNTSIPNGLTIVDATADAQDPELSVDSVEVLENDLTVDETQGCAGTQLEGGRAVLVVLSGGTVSDEETIVTVNWVDSEGGEDSRDGRFLIVGAAAA